MDKDIMYQLNCPHCGKFINLNVPPHNNLKNEDKYTMIKEALLPKDFNFIVTPKEIDDLIENMSSVIARGINLSL